MSITVHNFFNMPEGEVPRGPGGRPRLVPRGLEGTGIRADYTRASSMAENIEKMDHIHKWEMRYLAKAMGQNEDLAALAACETYSTGLTNLPKTQQEKTASGKRLDDIIERALDRVRIHEKADQGTSIHGFTEPGAPSGTAIPARLRARVKAFWDTVDCNGIELVGTEQFTANDITMSAGTFDHLVRVPGHPLLTDYVIGDKKTGRYSPFEWAIQLSTYAYGEPYDVTTDERPAWPGPVNTKWGLVFLVGGDEQVGTCELHYVDLEFGWEMAQLAAKVRDGHERSDICGPFEPTPFTKMLNECQDLDDLRSLWLAWADDPLATSEDFERLNKKARTLK